MDPISAIGLVSAVAGLADIISRSISSLRDLQSRFRSVDLKVNLLVGQLSTLKTALSQIAELNARLSRVPQHQQLVQNLATSLGCCEILILDLDDKLCSSQRRDSNGLDALAKIQFLQDEKTITDYLSLLNNQINALNLLLTALQCHSIPEQGTLLESKESYHVFANVREDTSSLLWLRDPGSCATRRSIAVENLDLFDLMFDFDRELCSSKVYRTATRSNMKVAILDGRRDKDKFAALFPYVINGPYDQAGADDSESSGPALAMYKKDLSPGVLGTKANCLTLRVVVLKARNLAAKDKCGTSHPFFVLTLGESRYATQYVPNTLNPEWNCMWETPVSGIDCMLLDCVCWHKDRFGRDYLGEFELALEDIFANENTEQPAKWYPLMTRRASGKRSSYVSGEVQLQFTLYDSSIPGVTPRQVMEKFWSITGAEPEAITPTKTGNGTSRARVPSDEDDDDHELYKEEEPSDETNDPSKPETVSKSRRQMRIKGLKKRKQHQLYEFSEASDVVGIVFLEIGKITDLPPKKNLTRTSFAMDPFVVASLGKKTYRTRAIRHNLNPVFNEKMIFRVFRHEQAYLISFTVIDRDKLSGNDFIGSASFSLHDITSTAPGPDPETGLYDLRDPPDSNKLPSKSETLFKISSSQSSSQSLSKLARPELTSTPIQTQDPNSLLSPVDHGEGFHEHGDPDLHCFTIPLQLKIKEKWEEKHSPELTIRAKYLPYSALRQQFWRAMLKQYNTDESGCISRIELSTMLDTLGSTLKESTIDSFFKRFPQRNSGEDSWELSIDEAVICLEDQLCVKSKQSMAEKVLPDFTATKNLIPSILTNVKAEVLSSSTSLAPTSSLALVKPVNTIVNEKPSIDVETQNFDDFGTAGEESEYLDPDDLNDWSEEHVVEIQECPICHQPRLHRRSDADIITHIATCASQDWRQIKNIVMTGFVTSSQAQRNWYSKVITKISYGDYRLGADSANILVQDRITGQINEERMSISVRLGTRLLYNGLKSKEMEKKRIRKLLRALSIKQGMKYDNPASKIEIQKFIQLHQLDMSEILLPVDQFKNFNEFFCRQLKPNARPCSAPDNLRIIVSPTDCRSVVFNKIDDATRIWVKGREFSVERLIGNTYPESARHYINGALGIFRLAPQDYHRFHVPVDGILGTPRTIEGEYYAVNPMEIRSALDVYGENVRTVVPIDSVAYGMVMVICVGSTMVGSTVITRKRGEKVARAEELGYFKFGGSTILLLFEAGSMRFDEDLVDNSTGGLETLLRVGMSIGHHPQQPQYGHDMRKVDADISESERAEAKRRIEGC